MRSCCFFQTISAVMLILIRTNNAAFVSSPSAMRRAIIRSTAVRINGAAGLRRNVHHNGYKLSPSVHAVQGGQRCLLLTYTGGCYLPSDNAGLRGNQYLSKSNFADSKSLRLFSSTKSSMEEENLQSKIEKEAASKHKKKSKNKKSKNNKTTKSILRVDRILSNRGVGSRSETHRLIKDKRISTYDEKTQQHVLVSGPSERLPVDVRLYIDKTHELPGPIPKVLIFHKPKNVLSETMDRNDSLQKETTRKHVNMYLDKRFQHKKSGLHPVGRLDYDSSGLLLFSSEGALTQRLLHPRHEVEKEYVATVEGMDWKDLEGEEGELRRMLEEGVETAEGVHRAKLLEVVPLRAEMESSNEEEEDKYKNDNQSAAPKTEKLTDVRLIVQEGKYRMVRRMLANCGYPVIELKRIRQGMVTLNDDLQVGQFREATEDEWNWLDSLLD